MKEHNNYFNRNLQREEHKKAAKAIKEQMKIDSNKISNKTLA